MKPWNSIQSMFGRPKPSIPMSSYAPPPPCRRALRHTGEWWQLIGNFHSFPNHALPAQLVRCKRIIMILLVIQIRFLNKFWRIQLLLFDWVEWDHGRINGGETRRAVIICTDVVALERDVHSDRVILIGDKGLGYWHGQFAKGQEQQIISFLGSYR